MKIGLLLPRSVIYPAIAFDMLDGLKAGLKHLIPDDTFEIATASIGVAAKNGEIYSQCEQLLLDGANLIIGYINPLAAEHIHPLFVSAGAHLLVLDSGYHFPSFEGKLSNAHFISLQGNLCSRAITRKALEDGHQRFAFTCSFYDAGYRLPYSYSMALEERGVTVGFNLITPLRRAEFTLEPLATYLSQNKDTVLLASFCGDMSEDFFRESSRLDLLSNHKTYGAAFTAEEVFLSKIPYPGNTWECVVPWSLLLSNEQNQVFITAMNATRSKKATIFSLLGWEAALFIAATKGDFDNNAIELDSPRGKLVFDTHTRFTYGPVYHANVIRDESNGNCKLDNISEITDLNGEIENLEKDFATIRNAVSANAWLNSYACLDS